jgi:hypothetical protein
LTSAINRSFADRNFLVPSSIHSPQGLDPKTWTAHDNPGSAPTPPATVWTPAHHDERINDTPPPVRVPQVFNQRPSTLHVYPVSSIESPA